MENLFPGGFRIRSDSFQEGIHFPDAPSLLEHQRGKYLGNVGVRFALRIPFLGTTIDN